MLRLLICRRTDAARTPDGDEAAGLLIVDGFGGPRGLRLVSFLAPTRDYESRTTDLSAERCYSRSTGLSAFRGPVVSRKVALSQARQTPGGTSEEVPATRRACHLLVARTSEAQPLTKIDLSSPLLSACHSANPEPCAPARRAPVHAAL